ncbi:MAG: hypothetical protein ACOCRK_01915, partial [bacterium]
TCSDGEVCRKRVCYYSIDIAGNQESTKTSDIFHIDKENPTTSASPSSRLWDNTDVNITLSSDDGVGSGVDSIEHCWTEGSNCTPSNPVTDVSTLVSQSSEGSWTLCHRSFDNVGNIGSTTCNDPYQIDKTNPVSSIDPNGYNWTPSDVVFNLSCNDPNINPSSGCNSTYYSIVEDDFDCASLESIDFIIGNSDTVTCASGDECWKKVCYFSDDIAGNVESVQESNTYHIDKQVPLEPIYDPESRSWDNSDVFVEVTYDDGGSGVGYTRHCWTDDSDFCDPGTINESTFTNGDNVSQSDTGEWTLCTRASDDVGNWRDVDCSVEGAYKIDKIDPVTSINPDGHDWINSDIDFDLTCTDDDSYCTETYYTIVEEDIVCSDLDRQSFDLGTSDAVTCASGDECWKKVCYFSIDAGGNDEDVEESSTFHIDKVDPITSINPDGHNWSPSDIDFDLTCTDDVGSGCNSTYYNIVEDDFDCASLESIDFIIGNSDTVTCASGDECWKKVCYFSDDIAGNVESVQESNTYHIDKQVPLEPIYDPESRSWDNSDVFVEVTYDDGGSGVGYTRHCWTDDSDFCDPGTINESTFTNGDTVSQSDTGEWTLCTRASDDVGNWRDVDCSSEGVYKIDKIDPVTSIDPDGHNWTGNDVDFDLTCTDDDSYCTETYYTIVNNGIDCSGLSPIDFDLGTSDTVTCLNGDECWKKVCYFSIDVGGNDEDVEESATFNIDKESPYFTTIPEDQKVAHKNAGSVEFNADDNVEFDYFSINDTENFNINSSTGVLSWDDSLDADDYYVEVFIYDIFGNENSTIFNLNITQVHTFLNNSREDITLEYNTPIWLNGSLYHGDFTGNGSLILSIEDSQLDFKETGNVSYFYYFDELGTFSIETFFTGNENYAPANETWNVNVVDTTNPLFINIPEDDELIYGERWFGVEFSSDDNFRIDRYEINDTENFNIDSTGYLTWTDQLSVDDYYVNITVYDTYGNYNYTIFNLNITKANTNLILNGSTVRDPSYDDNVDALITVEDETDIEGFGCPDQIECNLYRNGILVDNPNIDLLDVDFYEYVYNTSGNENYTSDEEYFNLNVIRTDDYCSIFLSESDNVTYPDTFNVWTNCTSDFTLFRNGTVIENNSEQLVSVGVWNYSVLRNNQDDYTFIYDDIQIEVLKGIPKGNLTSSKGWEFIFDESPTEIVFDESNVGDSDVEFDLWKNEEFIGEMDLEHVVGNYNYKINTTGGENYTALDNIDMNELIINKDDILLELSFDNESPEYTDSLVPKCEIKRYQNLSPNVVDVNNFCGFSVTEEDDDWIENIKIIKQDGEILLNISKNSSSTDGYHYYNDDVLELKSGDVLNISVTVNAISSVWEQYLSFGHSIFYDSLNNTFDLYGDSNTPWTYEFQWEVPYSPGNHLLSFWEHYNDFGSPCGEFSFGERQDFSIYIEKEHPEPVFTMNGTEIDSGVPLNISPGSYDFNCYVPESKNYYSEELSDSISISYSEPNLEISGEDIIYGEKADVEGYGCPDQLTCHLYRDGVLVNNPDMSELSVGEYNYAYNTSGNENFTSYETNFTLNVRANEGSVFMIINGSRDNITVEYDTILTLESILDVGEFGFLNLTVNNKELSYSNENDIYYEYQFDELGNFLVKTDYSGTNDFTSDSESFIVSVIDSKEPEFLSEVNHDSVFYGENWSGISFNSSDNHGIEQYKINDTENFMIDNSGKLDMVGYLPVGNYSVNVSIYDSSNNSDWKIFNLDVLKSNSSVETIVNNSTNNLTFEYNSTLLLESNLVLGEFGRLNLSIDNQLVSYSETGSIYYNYTFEELGNYIIESSYSGNDNYHPSSDLLSISIVDTTSPSISFNNSYNNYTYNDNWSGVQFNSTDNVEVDRYEINDTENFNISENGTLYAIKNLSAGDYSVNVTIYDTSGNYNWTLFNLTVEKRHYDAQIISSNGWNFEYDGSETFIHYITEENYGSDDVEIGLWRNDTYLDLNDSISDVGVYDYILNTSGGENYSSGIVDSKILHIQKIKSNVSTYLNNSREDISLEYNNSIYLNSTLDKGEFGSLNLTINGKELNFSPSNNISYLYNFNELGTFEISSIYSGNNNYQSDVETWTVLVYDNTSPEIYFDDYNSTMNYGNNWSGVNISSSDNVEVDRYEINDTENFNISENGSLYAIKNLSVGNYSVNVTVYDTSGNYNWTVVDLEIFKENPDVETRIGGIRNHTSLEYNESVVLESKLNEGEFGVINLSINNTLINSSNNVNIASLNQFNYSLGSYEIETTYSGSENYTSGSESWIVDLIDTESPKFIESSTYRELEYGQTWSGTSFMSSDNYQISHYEVNDSNHFVINDSGYLRWNEPLDVGNYYVNISVYDASNNLNWTIFNLVILKSVPELKINGTALINYGTVTDIIGLGCPEEINCTLYRDADEIVNPDNNSILDVGSYNYIYTTEGNKNYYSNSDSFKLNVNKSYPEINLTFNNESPMVYGSELNITCDLIRGEGNVTLYKNDSEVKSNFSSLLSVGLYNFSCSVNESKNFEGLMESQVFEITKSDPSLYISGSDVLRYGDESNVEGLGCPEQLNCSLKRNNNLVENPDITSLDPGMYRYTFSTEGNENYSSSEVVHRLFQEDLDKTIHLYIDGIRYDQTFEFNSSILLNTTLNEGDFGSLNLTMNGKELNYSEDSNLTYNYTFNELGEFKVTSKYLAPDNTTEHSESWNISIIDSTSPHFTYIPENISLNYGDGWGGINFDAEDNLFVDRFEINDTEKFTITDGGFLDWKEQLSAGTYNLNVSVYDTSNNSNWTIFNLDIRKSASSVINFINNKRSDQVLETTDDINVFGQLSRGEFGSLELKVNNDSINTFNSNFDYTLGLNEGGKYDVNVLYPENENFSSSFESWEILLYDVKYIDSCEVLDEDYTIYRLLNNLSDIDDDCFDIQSNSVILDLNGNYVSGSSGTGIYINSSNNYHIFDGYIEGFDYGIHVDKGFNNILENITISNSSIYGVYFESSHSNTIKDSDIENSGDYDVYAFQNYLGYNQNNVILNTDYDSLESDNLGFLIKWYMDVYVSSDSDSEPLSDVNVTLYNSLNEVDFTDLTDSEGFTNNSFTEYRYDGDSISYYSPHELDLRKNNYYPRSVVYNLSDYNESGNKRINLSLIHLGLLDTLDEDPYVDNITEKNISDEVDEGHDLYYEKYQFFASEEELKEGYSVGLANGWNLAFEILNEVHFLSIDRIMSSEVFFSLYSEREESNLVIGETKTYDLIDNGYDDIEITLKDIYDEDQYRLANFEVKSLIENFTYDVELSVYEDSEDFDLLWTYDEIKEAEVIIGNERYGFSNEHGVFNANLLIDEFMGRTVEVRVSHPDYTDFTTTLNFDEDTVISEEIFLRGINRTERTTGEKIIYTGRRLFFLIWEFILIIVILIMILLSLIGLRKYGEKVKNRNLASEKSILKKLKEELDLESDIEVGDEHYNSIKKLLEDSYDSGISIEKLIKRLKKSGISDEFIDIVKEIDNDIESEMDSENDDVDGTEKKSKNDSDNNNDK